MHTREFLKAASQGLVDPRAFGLLKAAYAVEETLDLLSIGRTSLYAAVKRQSSVIRVDEVGPARYRLRRGHNSFEGNFKTCLKFLAEIVD